MNKLLLLLVLLAGTVFAQVTPGPGGGGGGSPAGPLGSVQLFATSI